MKGSPFISISKIYERQQRPSAIGGVAAGPHREDRAEGEAAADLIQPAGTKTLADQHSFSGGPFGSFYYLLPPLRTGSSEPSLGKAALTHFIPPVTSSV